MQKDEFIGEIVRLQVQRIPIKVKGEDYLAHEILPIKLATVDTQGMLGWHDGAWIVDAHHGAHPSRRGGGRRPLSLGFTGHYEAMAERFGDAPLGVAGENIIVDGPALWLEDLGEGIVVETSGGELLLYQPRVAAPCVEFASFMLGLDEVAPRDRLEGELADLHNGRRGFIVTADDATYPVELSLGDRAYVAR